jgi:hypothetical protein
VARKPSSVGENEHHVVGVRMRVTGSGNLLMTLSDLDDIQSIPLVDLAMNATTRIEPTRLANFQSQRIRLSLMTTEIDENFLIKRIIIFAKPVAVEYPG